VIELHSLTQIIKTSFFGTLFFCIVQIYNILIVLKGILLTGGTSEGASSTGSRSCKTGSLFERQRFPGKFLSKQASNGWRFFIVSVPGCTLSNFLFTGFLFFLKTL